MKINLQISLEMLYFMETKRKEHDNTNHHRPNSRSSCGRGRRSLHHGYGKVDNGKTSLEMKTFIQWLRSLSRPSVKDRREQMRIDMFWSFANRYNGTDDCDIAGLFMTAAERARKRLSDNT